MYIWFLKNGLNKGFVWVYTLSSMSALVSNVVQACKNAGPSPDGIVAPAASL